MVWWRATGATRPLRRITRSFSDARSNYVPFEEATKGRQQQARKSVLVQVNSELSFSELHSYCSNFGTILGVHHYTLPNNHQNFMLLEFNNDKEAADLILSACFTDDADVIPVHSPFLWFRPPQSKNNFKISSVLKTAINTTETLNIKNGTELAKEIAIDNALSNANCVSEQIEILYNMTRLNDLGTRLRYLTARQIECAFVGLFPKVSVYPFGSSVNGFGKMGCDLDLVMKLTSENCKDELGSRLVFHAKKSVTNGRYQQQRYMEIVSDMIQLFIPGCSHVRRILQARIPIIKYNQDYSGLECDLSMSSLSGLYMSELLYIFGCFDTRVKPLVFTIRKWAHFIGLTNSSPGKWITNFPLTLMVLFFLQNAPDGPIIPNYNLLKTHADQTDFRVTDDFVNCTYKRDIRNLPFISNNTSNLEELLSQFFDFYSRFDFTSDAISINDGKVLNKTDYSALYIVNPLETNLNVSKNVSHEECERMRIEFRNASWILDPSNSVINGKVWGLNQLLTKKVISGVTKDFKRMVVVKDLFEESKDSKTKEEMEPQEIDDKIKSLSKEILAAEKNNQEANNYFFKNSDVQNMVNNVKKEYTQKIRLVRSLHDSSSTDDDNKLTNRRKVRRR